MHSFRFKLLHAQTADHSRGVIFCPTSLVCYDRTSDELRGHTIQTLLCRVRIQQPRHDMIAVRGFASRNAYPSKI